MKLYVSRADIDKGKRGDPEQCPIALAAKRAYPGKRVSVAANAMWIEDDRYLMGEQARYFVRVVDGAPDLRPRPMTLWFSRFPTKRITGWYNLKKSGGNHS